MREPLQPQRSLIAADACRDGLTTPSRNAGCYSYSYSSWRPQAVVIATAGSCE